MNPTDKADRLWHCAHDAYARGTPPGAVQCPRPGARDANSLADGRAPAQGVECVGAAGLAAGCQGRLQPGPPLNQISVADVVAALEGPILLTECTERPLACSMEEHCAFAPTGIRSTGRFSALSSVTLADMARPLQRDNWLKQLLDGIHRTVIVL